MNRLILHVVVLTIMVLFILSISYQMYSFWSFKQQGGRFTAENGYELCLRIAALEVKNGIQPIECK